MGQPLAFLLSGVGDQHVGMAAELYLQEPVFRAAVDECCELFLAELGIDLREVIYPGGPRQHLLSAAVPAAGFDLAAMMCRTDSGVLDVTDVAQPAVFAVGYALAVYFGYRGIKPDAMIGHSLGEYIAACLAGVFSLPTAVKVVACRAKLIVKAPRGAMCVVLRGRSQLEPYLGAGLWLAAVDSPAMCVVSGESEAIDCLQVKLTSEGVASRRLTATHAFHSPMLRQASVELASFMGEITLEEPKIAFISNVSGTWITADEATSPGYWARHMCEPVLFMDGVEELWQLGSPVLLEIGPGQSLGSLALSHPSRPNDATVISTIPGPRARRSEVNAIADAVRRLAP